VGAALSYLSPDFARLCAPIGHAVLLDLDYRPSLVLLHLGQVQRDGRSSGSGSAELLRDASLAIAFAYHLGDEAVLKAGTTSSATC
jgi:hypothetical protein